MPYKDPAKNKVCKAAYYQNEKKQSAARMRDRRARLANWVHKLKEGLKCQLCSENHPACLDFHHRNPKDKINSIAFMIGHGWHEDKITAEIMKCDVLCANCHRKYHFETDKQFRRAIRYEVLKGHFHVAIADVGASGPTA